MLELLKQPMPWYVAGPLIGLLVPALLLLGNKHFGISSSFRHICAACVPAKIPFFKYNWKKEMWNLFLVAGIVIGAFITQKYFSNNEPVQISESTKQLLQSWHITDFSGLMPMDIFGTAQILSLKGLIFMVIGGFLVGFGTRYAGGCTSGHSIMGLSNLQFSSLIATCGFMLGGILMSNFILPYIFKLF
ncbi:MAG: YeeE/YedE thiosulfate transporter family protein [Chitinophagales bacterium]|nr:YeeE/YedE family protein [Bacteroidota bacterium]